MNKKTVKLIIGVSMTLIMSGLMITGCGKNTSSEEVKEVKDSQEETTGGNDKVELTYYSWNTEDAFLPEIWDAFNASQDRIHVNYISVPTGSSGDTYNEKLQVLLQAKGDIDFFGVQSVSDYSTFASHDMLLEINDYIKEGDFDLSSIGSLENQINFNGKYYGLPYSSTAWVMFYNKDIFDEEGLEYPGQMTWQEYADLCYQLTKQKEDGEQQWGTMFYSFGTNDTQFYSVQSGESLADDEIPNYKYGLDILNQIFITKQSSMSYPELVSQGTTNCFMMFANGNVATSCSGTFDVAVFNTWKEQGEMDVNWDIAPLPVPEGVEPGTSFGTASIACVAKNTEHPAEVYEALSYLAGSEAAKVIARVGNLPANFTEEAQKIYRENNEGINTDIIFNSKIQSELPIHPASNDLVDAAKDQVELFLIGEKTEEETLEAFEMKRKEILQR